MSTVADIPRTSMKSRTLPATSLKDTIVVYIRVGIIFNCSRTLPTTTVTASTLKLDYYSYCITQEGNSSSEALLPSSKSVSHRIISFVRMSFFSLVNQLPYPPAPSFLSR